LIEKFPSKGERNNISTICITKLGKRRSEEKGEGERRQEIQSHSLQA
jgi:hypothetical protein